MDGSIGRREAHRRATEMALRDAAEELFSEHGYEATTVREIAAAAGVTERTFYRYFDGKEGLLAAEALAWVDRLVDAIGARPVGEPPFLAVQRAMIAVAGEAAAGSGPGPLWLFGGGRSGAFTALRRATPRPLLRLEEAVAAALLERFGEQPEPAGEAIAGFEAQLLARVAVAALRSAAIRRRALRGDGRRAPSMERLLEEAFAILSRSVPPPAR